jgi:hypothetical protein
MAANLISFLRNTSPSTSSSQVVEAPAFSLTKVMALVAPLVTGIASVAINVIKKKDFSPGQWTTIIVALIAFLAITSAADVIARGIATSATKSADGLEGAATKVADGLAAAATKASEGLATSASTTAGGRLHMTAFKPTVRAQLSKDGPDEEVTVVAVSDADESLSWEPMANLTLKGR